MQESIYDQMLQGAMEQWFARRIGDAPEAHVWSRLIELATAALIIHNANRGVNQ
jgi:hypothetical protein